MRSREVVVLFIYSLWLSASDLSSEVAISDVRRELVAASSSVRASRPWQPQQNSSCTLKIWNCFTPCLDAGLRLFNALSLLVAIAFAPALHLLVCILTLEQRTMTKDSCLIAKVLILFGFFFERTLHVLTSSRRKPAVVVLKHAPAFRRLTTFVVGLPQTVRNWTAHPRFFQ